MTQQALKLIQECLDNKAPSLDLGNCGLTDLNEIPELSNCHHVETLILSNEWFLFEKTGWVKETSQNSGEPNRISALPQYLHHFKNLKVFICSGKYDDQ